MEALFLFLFQWMGEVGGVGPLPVHPPHASANPSSRPIASVFSLCPNGKRKRVPLYVHCPSFCFFISQGKEPEKRKIRTRGEMKTAPSSLCLIFAPPSPVLISLPLFFFHCSSHNIAFLLITHRKLKWPPCCLSSLTSLSLLSFCFL